MVQKLLIAVLVSLFFTSCVARDLSPSQSPILLTTTPLVIPSATAVPSVQPSVTPFPDEKSLNAITADGKWEISRLLGYDSTIQVRSVDGKTIWVLDETTLPDVQFGQLWNYKTSNDNSALYFGLDPRQSETIITHRWPPTYGLYKLNLADGAIETILEPHIDSSGFVSNGYLALSPDELQIVYSWWDEPAIVVRDRATLEEQLISLPDDYKIAGPFIWSPNGKSVIFTMWSTVWDYPTEFQIARLDIDEKSIHSLFSDNEENRFWVPTEWVQEDLVCLEDRQSSELWNINPFTGLLRERTATTP